MNAQSPLNTARLLIRSRRNSIAKVGDIDHLVATPKAVWVIETKYGAVPPGLLSETVNRIGDNMGAVREWAGQVAPGKKTPVRGCLVLAYEDKDFKKKVLDAKKKDGGKEKVALFTKKSLKLLSEEMAGEAQEMQSLDEQSQKKFES
ncbi:MAG: nuclease-related domain-containing protein [Deltaproteobacteria bacterium]|nr:nuclease-related domain-containing protein [Deltaproteobacteria bacterium]